MSGYTEDPSPAFAPAHGYATVAMSKVVTTGCLGLSAPQVINGWAVLMDGVEHKPFRKLRDAKAYAAAHNDKMSGRAQDKETK